MFALLIVIMLIGLFIVFGGAFAVGAKAFPIDED